MKKKILVTHGLLFLDGSHADVQELADFTGKNHSDCLRVLNLKNIL